MKVTVNDKRIFPTVLLLSDNYPFAMDSNGLLYGCSTKLDNIIKQRYKDEILISENPHIEFFPIYLPEFNKEDERQLVYVTPRDNLFQTSYSLETYMWNHNCAYNLETVFNRLKEQDKNKYYNKIVDVVRLFITDFGELAAVCKVRDTFYFKKHVFKKTLEHTFILDVHEDRIDTFASTDVDNSVQRVKTPVENLGHFDERAMRSLYIDLPILQEKHNI